MGLTHGLTSDAVAERRRRRRHLLVRYLNDPDVYVITIRLEPGPSGELLVIVTLRMTGVF